MRTIRNSILLLGFIFSYNNAFSGNPIRTKLKKLLEKDILIKANEYLKLEPVTITASFSNRSAGNKHDFFSEGDYWWPNPKDPTGPYIQKDGLTNPDNFVAHRKAMIRFSQIVGTLTSAYLITKDDNYVNHAFKHLSAWFIDTATSMNPSLLYAQAIKGKVTGRSIGIIDMIQMIEVAQSVFVLQHFKPEKKEAVQKIKKWFENYLQWVTTHPYGIEEKEAKNNHGTCWVMQVAVFAKLVNNQQLLDECKTRFTTILVPGQLDKEGAFPLELKRTKPYGYSLFNLDAMTTICFVLSTKKNNLWDITYSDNRSLKGAIEFMVPFVEKKETWKYPKDVMYWDEWPVAQPFLLFGSNSYHNKKWFNLWKKLEHFPTNEEVIRNLPVRNPLIWFAG
ncbi:MAG: alginate lyase family protein [Ferruginibacter sp.]